MVYPSDLLPNENGDKIIQCSQDDGVKKHED